MGAGTWRRLDGGASVVPLRGGIRAAADISSGRLDPVSAGFVDVQEPAVAGLAGRTLEPRRATAQQTAGLRCLQCESHTVGLSRRGEREKPGNHRLWCRHAEPAGRDNIVPRATMAGKTVNVQVTEYFPGYQCSINNMDWSPAVMFDAITPFADVRTNYFPIEITDDGYFPVVDELGSPLGIEIRPNKGHLNYEALLRIETNANDTFGVLAQLEIEFDRPGYYNSLRLTPFVNMPVYLLKIQAEGMLTNLNSAPIFEGNALIDRPMSIRFADVKGNPIFVRRLFLDLYQPTTRSKSTW
jgi:hypothetical protein